MHLRQYMSADNVIALGALQFPQTSGPVPLKKIIILYLLIYMKYDVGC